MLLEGWRAVAREALGTAVMGMVFFEGQTDPDPSDADAQELTQEVNKSEEGDYFPEHRTKYMVAFSNALCYAALLYALGNLQLNPLLSLSNWLANLLSSGFEYWSLLAILGQLLGAALALGINRLSKMIR